MDGEAGRGRRRHKTPQWKYFFAAEVVKKYKGTRRRGGLCPYLVCLVRGAWQRGSELGRSAWGRLRFKAQVLAEFWYGRYAAGREERRAGLRPGWWERNAELCHSHTHWLGRMGRGRKGWGGGITNLGNATVRVLENLGSQGSPAGGTWRRETCSEETSLRPQCLWMTEEREVSMDGSE